MGSINSFLAILASLTLPSLSIIQASLILHSTTAKLNGLSSRLLCEKRAHSGLCNVAQGERKDCSQAFPNQSNILCQQNRMTPFRKSSAISSLLEDCRGQERSSKKSSKMPTRRQKHWKFQKPRAEQTRLLCRGAETQTKSKDLYCPSLLFICSIGEFIEPTYSQSEPLLPTCPVAMDTLAASL